MTSVIGSIALSAPVPAAIKASTIASGPYATLESASRLSAASPLITPRSCPSSACLPARRGASRWTRRYIRRLLGRPPVTTPGRCSVSELTAVRVTARWAWVGSKFMEERSEEGLARRGRLLVLGICCMSLLIVGLDTTIVNVALPSIHHAFHSSVAGLQWTIDAYTLVLASLLMLGGSTGDRIGCRQVFLIGLTVFLLGSLLCGLAPTLG